MSSSEDEEFKLNYNKRFSNNYGRRRNADSSDLSSSEDDQNSNSQHLADQQRRGTIKRVHNRRQTQTILATHPIGNIQLDEICYYSVEEMCPYESNGCVRLHATLHFHWQIRKHHNWHNLSIQQAISLECAYCDPQNDNHIIENSGTDPLQVNFIDMTASNVSKPNRTYQTRRLCTESIVNKQVTSNTFIWYFVDANNKCVPYGQVDTTGRDHLKSQVTSNDINAQYHQYKHHSKNNTMICQNSVYRYTIDFKKMTQTNMSTKVSRRIKCRPQLDNKLIQKPTFMSSVLQSISEIWKGSSIDLSVGKTYSAQVGIPKISSQANIIPHAASQFFSSEDIQNISTKTTLKKLTKKWEPMQPKERVRMVNVQPMSKEYQTVVNMFNENYIITKIERIQNPCLYRAFDNKLQDMVVAYNNVPSKADVRQLFHGTKLAVVEHICLENFDWRLNGTSTGNVYGKGTYFSPDVKLSYGYCQPDSAGCKYMFIARVAVGTMVEGDSSMVRPPTNSATGFPYDTTVNNMYNPTIIVKYDKQEYYPEYIVTLK